MAISLRARAVTGARWNSLSVMFCTLCQFLQTIVLARLIDPKDFGLMAMVTVVVGFSQIFADMGISKGIIYRQDASREELSSLYWLTLAFGIVPCGCVILTGPLVAAYFKEPELTKYLAWGALTFVVIPFGQQFQLLLQKELLFRVLAKVEMFSVACGLVVATVSAWHGHGVYALIWGQLATNTAKSSIYSSIGWRRWRPRMHFRWKEVKSYLGFGLFQVGERSVYYLGRQLDKILIGSLLGAQALGYYSVAYQLVMRPYQVINPMLTKVAFPAFAIIQNDDFRLRSNYLKLIRIIALLLTPLYTVMIVVAVPFFHTFFGTTWDAAAPVFQILALLGFFYCLGNPLGSLMLAKGRADLGFYQNLYICVVYSAGVWVGSRFGLQGVAWSLVLTTVGLVYPFGFLIRWQLIRMTPREFLAAFSPFLLASWASGGLVMLLRAHMPGLDSGVVAMGVMVTVFGLAYLALVVSVKRSFLIDLYSMLRHPKEQPG